MQDAVPEVSGRLQDGTRTWGAGSFGHDEDLALLLAGGLPQVALILVALPVGAAHRHVVTVALGDTQTEAHG